ncbi:MAG: hypothetical protein ACE5JA_00415 [bacterium]
MRLIVWFLIALLLGPVLAGCREAKEDLEEYGHTVMTMPDRARVLSDLTRIRQALEFYKVEHDGKHPDSISELSLEGLYYTDEYEYDSSTGKVRSKSYPTL